MATMRASVSARVAPAAPRARGMVACHATDAKASVAAVAMAAAALISAAPVQAGVVLQQPELKKVFQSDGTPAKAVERPFRQPGAAPAVAAAPAEKKAEKKKDEAAPADILDPRAIALPGSIAVIAGLGLAASKIDDGFSEWINGSGALVRNSGNFAGFEEDIKGDNYLQPAGAKKAAGKAATKTGTKLSLPSFGTKKIGKK